MNKDVIYIEPEDDITDIITKIDNAKEKIVALVPPKKASVLRSVVNIKLITKTATSKNKVLVLVTTDPAIVKLAAATRILVAKNLQTAPSVPDLNESMSETTTEELIEEKDNKKSDEPADGTSKKKNDEEEDNDDDEEDEDGDEEGPDDSKIKKAKKDKKKKTKEDLPRSKNPVVNLFRFHKKLVIFGGIGIVALSILLVWALVIAPAATVTVKIQTKIDQLSQNVSFTEKLPEENASEGKFYLKTESLEEKNEITFEATGQKNIGEKAKGEVIVYAYFREKGNIAINAGSTFTISGLSYTSDTDATLSWNGKDSKVCGNNGEASAVTSGCLISGRVTVTAASPGAEYNISASSTGWSTTANAGVYSDSAMTGGTDELITVVQQADVDTALSKIKTTGEEAKKTALLATISDDNMVVDSTFKVVAGEPSVIPKVGEEVKTGEKAKLTVVNTASIQVIDKTKIEEFITEKAKLSQNYKIYTINKPFLENFMQVDGQYVGKLKASYVSGPKITENEIVDSIRGKGLGVVQHDLKDIEGVVSVKIDVSYPWVMSIPDDPNKITVIFDVEE